MGGGSGASRLLYSGGNGQRVGDIPAGGETMRGDYLTDYGHGGMHAASEADEESIQTLFHNSFDMWSTLGESYSQ